MSKLRLVRRRYSSSHSVISTQYPEELTVLEACFHHGNSTVELIKEYERCMETDGHPGLAGTVLGDQSHTLAFGNAKRYIFKKNQVTEGLGQVVYL